MRRWRTSGDRNSTAHQHRNHFIHARPTPQRPPTRRLQTDGAVTPFMHERTVRRGPSRVRLDVGGTPLHAPPLTPTFRDLSQPPPPQHLRHVSPPPPTTPPPVTATPRGSARPYPP